MKMHFKVRWRATSEGRKERRVKAKRAHVCTEGSSDVESVEEPLRYNSEPFVHSKDTGDRARRSRSSRGRGGGSSRREMERRGGEEGRLSSRFAVRKLKKEVDRS